MNSDHINMGDQAKPRPHDQARSQLGIERIEQQLMGKDAPSMQDYVPGQASDATKAQKGLERIEAELRASQTNLEHTGATKEIIHVPETKEISFDELKPKVNYVDQSALMCYIA